MRTIRIVTATAAALGLLLVPSAAGAQDEEVCGYPIATCPEEPAVAPQQPNPPAPETPPSETASPVAQPRVAPATSQLPVTGTDVTVLAGAAGLVLVGGGAMLVRRSRLAHVEG